MATGKKRKIRKMRPTARKNADGSTSSHLMVDSHSPERKKKKYGVYPSIAPKKGKGKSTKAKDWKEQNEGEAKKRGEYIPVKKKKRAEKLAAGAWKKGKDRKEAMTAYRAKKKATKTTKKKK